MRRWLIIGLLLFCRTAAAQTPTLVQFTNDSLMNSVAITVFPKKLPNPARAGNLLVVIASWGSSTATMSVSDDKANTWTAGPSVVDTVNNQTLQIFYALNVAAGTQTITPLTSAAAAFYQCSFYEFFNVATSAATDGSSSLITTAGTSIPTGSITTTVNGDLILYGATVDNIAAQSSPLVWTPGAGFTGMVKDGTSFMASQYEMQATAGAINPAMTVGAAVTSALACGIAFKRAAAGSGPAAGIHVNSAVIMSTPVQLSSVPNPITLQYSTTGNLNVVVTHMTTTVAVTGITDSKGNTYVKRDQADNPGNGASIQIWDAANAVPDTALTITITYAGVPAVGPSTGFWDISGAATAPFDVSNRLTGNLAAQTGTVTGPSITPATANGVIISAIEEDGQTVGSATPGYLMTVQADGYQNMGLDRDSGWLHYYNPNTSAVSIAWTYVNREGAFNVGNWETVIAAYKAAATATAVPGINKRMKLEQLDEGK